MRDIKIFHENPGLTMTGREKVMAVLGGATPGGKLEPFMPGTKAVVLLSGGVDSTTAAYQAKAQGFEVHALTILYGQKAQPELEAAKRTATKICESHKIIDLSALADIWESPLINQAIDPSQNDREGDSAYVVPLRNVVFLSIAHAYAQTIGAARVYIGNHADDTQGFPDCSELTIGAMNSLIAFASEQGKQTTTMSPWQNMSKVDIIKRGQTLNVPWADTYSCYADKPCGVCESCMYRKAAFKAAEVIDPTEYPEV